MKNTLRTIIILGIASIGLIPTKAHSYYQCVTDVGIPFVTDWWPDAQDEITEYITDSFDEHEDWIVDTWWEKHVLPALRDMADELTAVSTYQAFMIGTFFDAKHQLETQQTLQEIRARAHKDYHPSTGMCEFGSISKSLAASERKAEFNSLVLAQRSQSRELGSVGTASAAGDTDDFRSRIDQFKTKFCDPADNNDGLGLLCGGGASDKERINKDIDYARTVDSKWTLDVDYTDGGAPTDGEEEIFALATNLYGHDVARPSAGALDDSGDNPITKKQEDYLTLRSLLAKRSVAQHSFNEIVAMKSEGLPGAKDYLFGVMEELGVTDTDDLEALLGENPSYYAQMEVLTKKLYQNPDFYTNLYDKPANVTRKEVALQAIGLMQKFDLFKSHLRSEATIAVLLELEVDNLQGSVEDAINDIAD
jgi:hypothetical protein